MLAKVFTLAIVGLDTQVVEVEVDIQKGKNKINIIGLPDKAVTEAQDRIIPALKNSKCSLPKGNITVNLAPANLHKFGAGYDLPIAIGILLASEQIKFNAKNKIFVGELSLDGKLRYTNGILAIADGAYKESFDEVFVPRDNIDEANLITQIKSFGVDDIDTLVDHLENKKLISNPIKNTKKADIQFNKFDMKTVRGQEHARRAIEIAAAGGHNCLMVGTPGSGKTFLSRCMPSILPPMSLEESLDVTRIYSVAGKMNKKESLIRTRPFRSPHHTSSQVSLVGGGSFPKPGEITLAHRGVLFLDEFAEFNTQTLEALRQPVEDKVVQISRANGTIIFPANFILLAAMNPCKCGFRGDPDKECNCTASEYLKYQRKISGPVMDRIDLQVKISRVNISKLTNEKEGESSEEVRKRVIKARNVQQERYKEFNDVLCNSEMNHELIKKYINLNKSSLDLLKAAIDSFNLSARSYFRILKTARTIADLDEKDIVTKDNISEALSYRI